MVKVLAIDVGGTHVKVLATGADAPRRFDSGPGLSAAEMVDGVQRLAAGWSYDVVSIGFPGPVGNDRPLAEPHNLGGGWVDFDFEAAFGRPVRMMNDAAMQALGSYRGGSLLFLGLGTGLGSALIKDGVVAPLELGRLPYRRSTFEDHVGQRGLDRLGKRKWRKRVDDVVARLIAAFRADDVVLGGGNIKYLKAMPEGCRPGDNANAFAGAFGLWKGYAPRRRK